MNTIKNYLESMFANMPNTAEILRAKDELWQMMEDKYNELISEGKTENEAVGTVISEFGNLEDLAEELGISMNFSEEKKSEFEVPRRMVTAEETKEFVASKTTQGIRTGIATFLCITSVCAPILISETRISDAIGVLIMMCMIAVAVVLYVLSGLNNKKWDFLKKQACSLDYATAQEVSKEKDRYANMHAVRLTVGILLCVLCWIPAMILDDTGFLVNSALENLIGASIFVCVGIGVFLIILTTISMEAYEILLNVNSNETVSGSYGKEGEVQYLNDTITTIMELFWPTVTCLYLCVSFITFNWFSTWMIWPVAAIVHAVMKKNLRK